MATEFFRIIHKSAVDDELIAAIIPFLKWRDGRVVEGAPLLREYGRNPIEGSNPSFSAMSKCAPVAQLDRVSGYEPGGRRFESFRARHINQ